MIPFRVFMAAMGWAQALPNWARYLVTIGLVAAVFAIWFTLLEVLPAPNLYLLPILGVLTSAVLFDRGAGLLATGLSAAIILWCQQPTSDGEAADHSLQLGALALFVLIGLLITLVIEGFQTALGRLEEAHAALARTDGQRRLLLREFRHRTRNDLQSLVALLLLRARAAPSPAAQDGLREAAEHAWALARVHTLLAQEAIHEEDPTVVDSRAFVEGLVLELARTHAGEGLRPVAVTATAESHPLDSERAILVGLMLNECVTNALKYAFPDEAPGKVQVRFQRKGEDFVLTVEDDGTGSPREEETPPALSSVPTGTGLGTRLLRGMAAQLHGGFTRGLGAEGTGTRAELCFPVQVPAPPSRRRTAPAS